MRRFLLIVLILAFAITACATGCATTNSSWTPLPEPGTPSAIKIVSPGQEVPPQIANYSGVWEGMWDLEIYGIRSFRAMAVTIVIEKIESSRVTAIYSWGNWRDYTKEGWVRMNGTIKDGKIILSGYATITLESAGNSKTAYAIYSKGNWRGDAMLIKKDPKDLQLGTKPGTKPGTKRDISNLPEKIRAYHGEWKGMFNNGTPITVYIEARSEKTAFVIHSWEDNPYRNVTAGSWSKEIEFTKDGYISIVRDTTKGKRFLTYKLNKDGTLYVSLEGRNENGNWWIVDGDLKKVGE